MNLVALWLCLCCCPDLAVGPEPACEFAYKTALDRVSLAAWHAKQWERELGPTHPKVLGAKQWLRTFERQHEFAMAAWMVHTTHPGHKRRFLFLMLRAE